MLNKCAFVNIRSVILALLLAWSGWTNAAPDDDFLAAREAFRVGDSARLDVLAKRLSGHVLEPYVLSWQVRMRLEQLAPAEIRATLARFPDAYAMDRLRADWLRQLGRKGQWEHFGEEIGKVQTAGDLELTCYQLQYRLAGGDAGALAAARPLWLTDKDTPEACNPLFDRLVDNGSITAKDVWERLRLAWEAGSVGAVKRQSGYLRDGPTAAVLDAIAAQPNRFLDRQGHDLNTRTGREMALFAIQRIARNTPPEAAAYLERIGNRLSSAERAQGWAWVAHQAAKRLQPEAVAWFERAQGVRLTDAQAGWKVRAALRLQDWAAVQAAIQGMSDGEAQDPAWRYWKARALKAQGQLQAANQLWATLSREHNFYGKLAAEELGTTLTAPAENYKPSKDEVAQAGNQPSIRRALALLRLNLRFEATREWIWAIRDMDDRSLLAAAEVARRNDWYDRAINTADKTKELHDFSLRYLAPFREAMQEPLKQTGLDEAWVYGLIRQESRFIADAKSSAGAAGLMQLMPATAKWVAGKMGWKGFVWSQVHEVDTNVALGTYYLRHVYDTLDGQPVLATAAYNAGPGRARAWRAAQPMEGAIYTESIPFNETRDYVKKVLTNAMYYANNFGQRSGSLKQRLGIIGKPAEKSDDAK